MKTTRPNRGIMPQAARSAPFTSADAARGQMSPACAERPFRPGRAPASVATAIAVNPSASSQAFAQMAAEEPMHSPQYNALGAGGQRGDVSPDKKLLPKLIANVKFNDRIEASPPQARTAA
jgi:hypothetical protein